LSIAFAQVIAALRDFSRPRTDKRAEFPDTL
jgi:hypothetical protein